MSFTSGCTEDTTLSTAFDPATATIQGTLQLPVTVHAENPRTLLMVGERHHYEIPVKAGAEVKLKLQAVPCTGTAPTLFVFDAEGNRVASAQGAGCTVPAQLGDLALPEGRYQLVIGDAADGAVSYALDGWCLSGAGTCTPDADTWAWTRDPGNNANERGRVLFHHIVRLSEGLGNAMPGGAGRPNMRRIHDGAFGGPDGQSCLSCHNQGEADGSGGFDDNIFQAGNGVSEDEALERNPLSLHGAGVKQWIGAMLTEQLHTLRDGAIDDAEATGLDASVELVIDHPDGPINFGSVTAHPDGSLDTSLIVGIDTDLEVRPFGVKGRNLTLRDFVVGGFRVHFGIQATEALEAFCANFPMGVTEDDMEDFAGTWGNPVNCEDPDLDTVTDELTTDQLDAMSVYLQELPTPRPAASYGPGFDAFYEAGCADCHKRSFTLPSLDQTAHGNAIALPPSGFADAPTTFEVWTDFRRHGLANEEADSKEFAGVNAMRFITPPLWDVANSAPYMYDGRAPTLRDAILEHTGECGVARDGFEALDATRQEQLLDFLRGLGRKQN